MLNVPLLRIQDLRTYYFTHKGCIKAVDNVSLELGNGEVLGIVGESGCGKSTLSLSILNLLPNSAKIVSGKVFFKGHDLLKMKDDELRRIRGSEISMVYQNPSSSLNPVVKVGDQIAEVLETHRGMNKQEASEKACQLMEIMGIPDAGLRMNYYPHQFSGGMLQRVVIAMAIACNPQLLVADEPTSALDVTIQAQILELFKKMREEFNLSMILVSHNFGVIAEMSDRVSVMYAGHIVELADLHTILNRPIHPYTQGLLKSTVSLGHKRLKPIVGAPPSLLNPPQGCRFHPRCPLAKSSCNQKEPSLQEVALGHFVKCYAG